MPPAQVQPHKIDRSLTTLLAVQVVTLFVAMPLVTEDPSLHILLDLCHLAYALVCVAALARHRVVQAVLIAALLLLIVGPEIGRRVLISLDTTTSAALRHDLIQVAAFAFNMGVTLLVARHVFGPGRVTGHRVRGAVLLYLNIAAVFGIVFTAILSHWPDALVTGSGAPLAPDAGGRTALLTYFSLSTLTTTGYGDVVPVLPLARSLANLEAVMGQLFPATLLARIVALHLEHSREED
ncbi:potassium channel family protein [Novosphingobium rosa]|uniref:potassium channel family protein n=1 Tax=Novosphingobium rosa TaxID=76978 RepID=UPI00082D0152|nr:potassium channel family protein [Novosphingobium rosa]